jgi:hypothetical protein
LCASIGRNAGDPPAHILPTSGARAGKTDSGTARLDWRAAHRADASAGSTAAAVHAALATAAPAADVAQATVIALFNRRAAAAIVFVVINVRAEPDAGSHGPDAGKSGRRRKRCFRVSVNVVIVETPARAALPDRRQRLRGNSCPPASAAAAAIIAARVGVLGSAI